MADAIENGFGAQALDAEAVNRALSGDAVRSGCEPSKGTNALEVDVASGVAQIGGEDTDISAQTVTLSSGSGDPRKDVVYLDATGTAQVAGGTPEPAQPTGEVRRQTYQPQPVDLSGTAGVVIAEVWVPASASDIVSDDISDRREVLGGGSVPSGIISMWSGAIADIPTGWTLCDGTEGTPDLRDRFVTGAGGQYTVGDTGGEDEHQLTIGEMPSHSHDAPIYTDDAVDTSRLESGAVNNPTTVTDAVNPTGGSLPHENRPPYYALAYIMKL